jgi:uncharacterized protein (DUF885 family)
MNAAFEQLGSRYIDESAALSPVSATWLGDHRFDDRLDDVGREALERRAAFCRTYLGRIAHIPKSRLSRSHQIDAALLAHALQAELWHLEEFQEWAWNPMRYVGLAGNAIYNLMARDFAPLRKRLSSARHRLEQFPRLMRQIREVLDPRRVPKVHAETAIRQVPGLIDILENMVEPHADVLSTRDQASLARALETARSAVEVLRRWLEKEVLPRAAGNFRIGRRLYDRRLAFALQGLLARKEIRERAESELRRVRQEMYEIAARVYKGEHPRASLPKRPSETRKRAIIRACLETAYRQAPDRRRIVAIARQSLARLTAFVRDADLVTVPPDPVEVIVMPEFRRGTSLAYCDSPGPLDAGQRTFYAIAPPPRDWTEPQVRSFLREYNLRSLHNLTVHEAMPGHFLQLAHANRYPSKLRAILASGVFIEGWAVYAERMMVDHGFLGGDPLMRLIVLKWYLRGIANAIIDQAVHAEEMTEDAAMRLMMDGTFQEEREAAGKWVRAQLTSAQLSTYFVGYLEHASLRREVEAAWGTGFDLKKYHDGVLSFGSPPTQYVRALMLDLPFDRAGHARRGSREERSHGRT